MQFKTTYKARHKLYKDYISKISDIRFTFREADIIACIMNNRGHKKIAQILSISPRTVSGHVYNIMAKLQCNSKDQIIDFVEKSSKALIVNEYYNHLLIEASFSQTLYKISVMIEQEDIICNMQYQDSNAAHQKNSTNKDNLLECIQENLKYINIKITNTINKQKKESNDADIQKNHIQLFIINNKSISDKTLSQFQGFGINKPRKIFISLDDENIEEKQKNQKTNFISNIRNKCLANISYIDFSSSQEYYLQFLLLVEKIFYKTSMLSVLNNLIQEFKDVYYSIINGAENNVTVIKEKSSFNILDSKYFSGLYGSIVVFIIGICIVLVCFTCGILIYNSFFSYPSTQKALNISALENELNDLVDKFSASANNILLQSRNSNHKYIQPVEVMLNEAILYDQELSFISLMNYLYLIKAYTHYKIAHNHNAQQIIEEFDRLSSEEQHSELHIIYEFAEIYNRLIHTLDITYVYEVNTISEEKYLNISYYFGNNTKLFDAASSVRNVIVIIVCDKAKVEEIIKGNLDIAGKKIWDIIKIYEYHRRPKWSECVISTMRDIQALLKKGSSKLVKAECVRGSEVNLLKN